MSYRTVKIHVEYNLIHAWENWSATVEVPEDIADEDIEAWVRDNPQYIDLLDLKEQGSTDQEIHALRVVGITPAGDGWRPTHYSLQDGSEARCLQELPFILENEDGGMFEGDPAEWGKL